MHVQTLVARAAARDAGGEWGSCVNRVPDGEWNQVYASGSNRTDSECNSACETPPPCDDWQERWNAAEKAREAMVGVVRNRWKVIPGAEWVSRDWHLTVSLNPAARALGMTDVTMLGVSASKGREVMDVYAGAHGCERGRLRFGFWGTEGGEHVLTEDVLVDQGVTRGMVLTVSPSSAYTEELEALRKEGEHVWRNRCKACGEESEGLKTCTSCKEARYCIVTCQRAHQKHHKEVCLQLADVLRRRLLC